MHAFMHVFSFQCISLFKFNKLNNYYNFLTFYLFYLTFYDFYVLNTFYKKMTSFLCKAAWNFLCHVTLLDYFIKTLILILIILLLIRFIYF